jgi:hypothetical protein
LGKKLPKGFLLKWKKSIGVIWRHAVVLTCDENTTKNAKTKGYPKWDSLLKEINSDY